jgi:organic radical activating enzyme
MSTEEIIREIGNNYSPLVVITGGEPLVQDVAPLSVAIAYEGYRVGLETNGTIPLPMRHGFSHISLSPKTKITDVAINPGEVDSLKILYPYLHESAEEWDRWGSGLIVWKGIQPIDGVKDSLRGAINEVRRIGNAWRLSVQLHKLIGVR